MPGLYGRKALIFLTATVLASFKDCDWLIWFLHFVASPYVGASSLAMVVNDYAFFQTARVIVDVHREQARSYR